MGIEGPPGTTGSASGALATKIASTSFSADVKSLITSGYAIDGDIGGGAIYVRGIAGGLGAVQSLDGAWWNLSRNQRLSVAFFGAKCDSTADDTAAVQAAIVAAERISGIVDFPGWCKTTTALQIVGGYIALEGSGGNCGIKPTPGASQLNGLVINTVASVVFRNFGVLYPQGSSPVTNAGAGFIITASTGYGENVSSTWEDVYVYFAGLGYDFQKASKFEMRNCLVIACTDGISVRNLNNPDSGDSSIVDCEIGGGATNNAIKFISSGGLRIRGTKINVAKVGVNVALAEGANTSGPYISNCSFEGLTDCAIRLAKGAVGQLANVTVVGTEAYAPRFLDIPADASGGWLLGLTVTGCVLNCNQTAVTNLFANINNVMGFVVGSNTMVKAAGGGTHKVFSVGATASYGVLGPIALTGAPEILSTSAAVNTTTIAPAGF